MAERATRRKPKARTFTDHDCSGADHHTLKDAATIPGRLHVAGRWWCQTCAPPTAPAACTHTAQHGNQRCAWCGGPTDTIGAPTPAVVDADQVDAEKTLLALAVYSSDAYRAGRAAAAAQPAAPVKASVPVVYARPEPGWPVGSGMARSLLASPARWGWPKEIQEWLADVTGRPEYEPEPSEDDELEAPQ